MLSLRGKKERTILVLGPPHSGKSTFSYLLFRALRNQGDDAALVDADLPSPTYRAYEMASDEEMGHVYVTPHRNKLAQPVPLGLFRNTVGNMIRFVKERGLIIVDGLGKHTDLTDFLLGLCCFLVVVCKHDISPSDLEECGFVDDVALHPFKFYSIRFPTSFMITSHLDKAEDFVDEKDMQAALRGLERTQIVCGDVSGMPTDTLEAIEKIASCIRWKVKERAC